MIDPTSIHGEKRSESQGVSPVTGVTEMTLLVRPTSLLVSRRRRRDLVLEVDPETTEVDDEPLDAEAVPLPRRPSSPSESWSRKEVDLRLYRVSIHSGFVGASERDVPHDGRTRPFLSHWYVSGRNPARSLGGRFRTFNRHI